MQALLLADASKNSGGVNLLPIALVLIAIALACYFWNQHRR